MRYKQVETRANSRRTFREGTDVPADARGRVPMRMQLRQPGEFLRTSGGDSDWGWDTKPLDGSQEEEVAKTVQGCPVQQHKNAELPSPCAQLSALAVPWHHTGIRPRPPVPLAFRRRKPKHTGSCRELCSE